MHSVEELDNNVPAFLAKLWKMVEDPETNDLISWSPSGRSFYIRNQARFSRELLPLYYKHNNMASFVRQLNMYGFHKVVSIEGGGLKIDKDEMQFAHSCFIMGHPYLLEHIKRKIPTTKSEENRTGQKPELINKVLTEVKTMKGRQDSVDSQLSAMKRENEVLWREVAILRQKHIKQQQIVNKLIQFLVSMVQPSRTGGIGIKRHYPLMLSDITHRPSKTTKLNGDISDVTDVHSNRSPTGPVIHELDPAELLDDCVPGSDIAATTEFLSTDLHDAVNNGEAHSPAPSSSSSKGSAAMNLNQPNCDMLFELVDDYPLSPEILKAASPAEMSPCITSSKERNRAPAKNKKRKSKETAIKSEKCETTDTQAMNVADFLEIVLPNLEPGSTSNVIESTIVDNSVVDPTETNVVESEEGSIAAATDAAISAINSVAASSCEKTVEESRQNEILGNTEITEEQATGDSTPLDMTLACASTNSAESSSIKSKEDFDSHLGTMQSELDSLKDLLKGEGYSLDANTLLGVCPPPLLGLETDVLLKLFGDDFLSYGISIVQENEATKDSKENSATDPLVSGSEVATYSSNLLDLEDLCDNSALDDWSLSDIPSFETDSTYPSQPIVGQSDVQDGDTINEDEMNMDLNTPKVVLLNNPDFMSPVSKKKKKK